MLAEFSTGPVTNLLGLGVSSLELAGGCVLAVGIVGYAIRLVYYSLSASPPASNGTGSANHKHRSDATYRGPYCAG